MVIVGTGVLSYNHNNLYIGLINSLPTIIEISVFVINSNIIKKFCVGGTLNI